MLGVQKWIEHGPCLYAPTYFLWAQTKRPKAVKEVPLKKEAGWM